MKNDRRIIYIVGIGPGGGEGMTIEADRVLGDADVIVGYETYLKLIRERYPEAEYISTPMKQERERCIMAFDAAAEKKRVALVCSGDAGVYGMASLMYEVMDERKEEGCELRVVAGVTAALSGAALLGAPVGHDFCVISLSDLLTPWEVIEKRLKAAAEGDFVIVLYNPSSHNRADHLKRAADILKGYVEAERICGVASLIGREGQNSRIFKLSEIEEAGADMFSTVFIGSSTTKVINGKMVTPRGYRA